MPIGYTLLFSLHAAFGGAALLLFWLVLASVKGGPNHRRFGGYYRTAMWTVAATGALMAVAVIADPMWIYGHRFDSEKQSLVQFAATMRAFYSFLLYLSLITAVGLLQGQKVLQCKKDKQAVKTPTHIAVLIFQCVSGIGVIGLGLHFNHTLLIIFGALGVFIATTSLHYSYTPITSHNHWLKEHIGAFIGTGIGAHTAFFAFGGRSLLPALGQWQLVFWIAPSIIGMIITRKMIQKYAADRTKNRKSEKILSDQQAGH